MRPRSCSRISIVATPCPGTASVLRCPWASKDTSRNGRLRRSVAINPCRELPSPLAAERIAEISTSVRRYQWFVGDFEQNGHAIELPKLLWVQDGKYDTVASGVLSLMAGGHNVDR